MTSEKLTEYCRSYLTLIRNQMKGDAQTNFNAGLCTAYVTGLLDSEAFSAGATASPYVPRLCLPRGLNSNTATEIVATFLDTQPQAREFSGYITARKALAAGYPCPS
jgi:hypothetical protein